MFNNPGRKLKLIAKIIFWVNLVLFIIVGIVVIAILGRTEASITGTLVGIIIFLIGIIVSWLSSIFLYAAGAAVDDIQTLRKVIIREIAYERNHENQSIMEITEE